jgi:hypothetical protein
VEPDPAFGTRWGQRDQVSRGRWQTVLGAALGVQERRPDAGALDLHDDHRTAVRRNEGVLDVASRVVKEPEYGAVLPYPQTTM